jgi:pyridoxamine 5'-phosphate oxidase
MRSVPDLLSFFRHNIIPDTADSSKITGDPYDHFRTWVSEAALNDSSLPDAISLKMEEPDKKETDDRIVVIKGFYEGQFAFFTNHPSEAGDGFTEKYARLVLFWSRLYRRVKISGKVVPMSVEESENYNFEYPFISNIHSTVGEKNYSVTGTNRSIDRSDCPGSEDTQISWQGYYLVPEYIEFCSGRQFLLNYRIKYSMGKDKDWKFRKLFPHSWYG